MNKKQFLRLVTPGIRTKLSFFTIILVTTMLAVTSVINYNQQKSALEEKLDSELKIPLDYINSVVLDLENLNRSLVLIEEFKIRVKDKKKELTKFKRTVVRKETGFLGSLKDIGKSLGLNMKRGNVYSSVDTYFSRYLSEKEIAEFETKVRGELRRESGAPIENATYQKMRAIAEKTAIEKIALEKNLSRSQEIEEEIAQIDASLENEASEEARKLALGKKTTLAGERKSIEQARTRAKKKIINFETALTKSLQSFFRGSFQERVSTLGLLPDKIRIIAYDHFGRETLDTSQLFPNTSAIGKKLFTQAEFVKNQKEMFSDSGEMRMLLAPDKPKSFDVSGRQYEVLFRPVFRNPNSAERAIKIFQSLGALEKGYDPYLEEDRKLASELKDLAIKLKARLSELRRDGKTKPSADKDYKTLSNQYQKILNRRQKSFEELNPHTAVFEETLSNWKKSVSEKKEQIKKTESEIKDWQLKLLSQQIPEKDKLSPEEIQLKIQNLESVLEELKDGLIQLEASRDDWSGSKEQILRDAYSLLRESALQDFAFVPYEADSAHLKRYFKESKERSLEAERHRYFREWILSGSSETDLPKYRGINLFSDSGVLVRSRSEAEEMMWSLDSTPILKSMEERSGLLFEVLEKDLLGYNLILLDRTEGFRQIKKNRLETMRYMAIIAFFAWLCAYLLAWLFVRRLKLISKQALEIEKGNLEITFPQAGYDEIGILSDSLNDMVGGLREREEMRGELAAAEEIQKRLLPEKLPTSLEDKIEISAFYKAMTGVGGDYYDFIELPDGKLAFCIGDVSNHGVGPAIVMALFRAQIRSIFRRGERNIKRILLEVNASLYEDTPDHIFVTFFLGVFDPNTSQVEYISAGHIKPLYYDASKNKIHELPAGGLPLGMDENEFFETTIERKGIVMDSGDIFFQYTDGLDEARSADGSFFGRSRVLNLLLNNGGKSASDVMQAMVAEAEQHTGQDLSKAGVSTLSDDMAMIAIRKKPDPTQKSQS
jgi:sigma-B regulation protein RsbU (phosphoserine phosphatase)